MDSMLLWVVGGLTVIATTAALLGWLLGMDDWDDAFNGGFVAALMLVLAYVVSGWLFSNPFLGHLLAAFYIFMIVATAVNRIQTRRKRPPNPHEADPEGDVVELSLDEPETAWRQAPPDHGR